MSWTEDRVELLKTLWAEGLSCSQIANRLGYVTRNAVIGKAHRLGLEGRATKSRHHAKGAEANARNGVMAERMKERRRAKERERRAEKKRLAGLEALQELAQVGRKQATGDAQEPAGERKAGPVGIMALTHATCRWPLWSAHGDDQLFCGVTPAFGSSYCPDHRAASISPRQPKPRTRPGDRP